MYKGIFIFKIFVYALYISKVSKLLGMHSCCNGTCRIVSINIVSLTVIIKAYRTNNRYKVIIHEIFNDGGINVYNLSYKTDILSITVFLHTLKKVSILSGDTHRFTAQVVYELYK